MPIKFACEHCGQVLSVSTTKAGKGAKCPKCHLGIIVPTAETAAATLAGRKPATPPAPPSKKPTPTALPGPAALSNSPPVPVVPPPLVAGQATESPPEPISPARAEVALLEPVASPPAQISISAPASLAPQDDADDPFAQFVVYDDGAEIVYAADEEDLQERYSEVDRDSLAVPRRVLYLQGALLGVVALVCFTLGVIVGGATSSGPTSQGPRIAKPCQVSGTVGFRDRRKETMPDDGSVVILLPQDARPDEKAMVLGLRPDDPTPDGGHSALAAIRSLGGDYARADTQGRFKVRVADTGPYFVLFISRNNKRKTGEALKTADLAQLGRYFADATDLIGENRYRWTVERIQSDRTLNVEFN